MKCKITYNNLSIPNDDDQEIFFHLFSFCRIRIPNFSFTDRIYSM